MLPIAEELEGIRRTHVRAITDSRIPVRAFIVHLLMLMLMRVMGVILASQIYNMFKIIKFKSFKPP